MIYYRKTLFGSGPKLTAVHSNAFAIQLSYTLSQLSLATAKLIVFEPWPILPSNPNYKIIRTPFESYKKNRVEVKVSDFEFDSLFFKQITQKNSGYILFDPAKKICGPINCNTIFNGVRLYGDGYHITPSGSRIYKSELMALLK